MSGDLGRVIGELFNDAARTAASHSRSVTVLKKLIDQDAEQVVVEVVRAVNRLLVVSKREASVDRVVQFLCLCSREPEVSLVTFAIVAYVLGHTEAADKTVRWRSMQLVAALIASLSEDVDVSDELFAQIADAALARTKDKNNLTRVAAVQAIARLQDLSDPNDQVVTTYLHMLGSDSSKEVRRAILAVIGVSKQTIPAIIQRTRDTRAEVRRTAYLVLGQKVPVKHLSIAQRNSVMLAGLADRNAHVVKAAVATLKIWLSDPKCGAGSPARLLAALDVENNTEAGMSVCRAMISEILGGVAKVGKEFINLGREALMESSSEDALFWRIAVDMMVSSKSKMVDDLPTLTEFCPVIESIMGAANPSPFVIAQMVGIACHLDLSEEVGRKNFQAQIVSILKKSEAMVAADQVTPTTILTPCIFALCKIHPNAYARVVEPVETVLAEAASVTSVNIWNISLAAEVLEHHPMGAKVLPRTLYDNFVVPGLASDETEVRNVAVRALGLFSILQPAGSAEVGDAFVPLLRTILTQDVATLRVTAAKALFDTAMVCNPTAGATEWSFIEDLSMLLQSSDSDLKAVAVEGFSKLLFTRRATSGAILSRLVLLFFNPTVSEESRIIQTLSVFFPAFAFSNPENSQLLQDCFMPTIRVIANAPRESPFSKVSAGKVASFLLFLTDSANGVDASIHGLLAVRMLTEILKNPDHNASKTLIKVLVSGAFHLTHSADMRAVSKLLEELGGAVTDKTLLKSIEKYAAELAELEGTEAAAGAGPSSSSVARSADEQLLAREAEILRSANMLVADARDDSSTTLDASGASSNNKPAHRRRLKAVTRAVAESDSEEDEDEDNNDSGDDDDDAAESDDDILFKNRKARAGKRGKNNTAAAAPVAAPAAASRKAAASNKAAVEEKPQSSKTVAKPAVSASLASVFSAPAVEEEVEEADHTRSSVGSVASTGSTARAGRATRGTGASGKSTAAAAAAAAPAVKAKAKGRSAAIVESDDEAGEEVESENEEAVAATSSRAGRSTRSVKESAAVVTKETKSKSVVAGGSASTRSAPVARSSQRVLSEPN